MNPEYLGHALPRPESAPESSPPEPPRLIIVKANGRMPRWKHGGRCKGDAEAAVLKTWALIPNRPN